MGLFDRGRRAGPAPLLFVAALGLSACVPPPTSSMERQARIAASAELAAAHCDGHATDSANPQAADVDVDESLARARATGATGATAQDLARAREHMHRTFSMAERFRSTRAACDELLHKIAWHSP